MVKNTQTICRDTVGLALKGLFLRKSYFHWTKVIKGPTCHCILSRRWVNTSCIQSLIIFCKKLHRIVSEYDCEIPGESEVSKHCFSAPGCI